MIIEVGVIGGLAIASHNLGDIALRTWNVTLRYIPSTKSIVQLQETGVRVSSVRRGLVNLPRPDHADKFNVGCRGNFASTSVSVEKRVLKSRVGIT